MNILLIEWSTVRCLISVNNTEDWGKLFDGKLKDCIIPFKESVSEGYEENRIAGNFLDNYNC